MLFVKFLGCKGRYWFVNGWRIKTNNAENSLNLRVTMGKVGWLTCLHRMCYWIF